MKLMNRLTDAQAAFVFITAVLFALPGIVALWLLQCGALLAAWQWMMSWL